MNKRVNKCTEMKKKNGNRTIRSQDYSFPGTNSLSLVYSFPGRFVPWIIRSVVYSFPRPFVPNVCLL